MTITLSPDQQEAVRLVHEWVHHSRHRTFVLAGLAGTGKTTVVSRLLEEIDRPVIVGTPTGKAAEVLRSKGVMADTIHRLAYTFRGRGDDGDLMFDYQGLSGGEDGAVLVVDEASMVDRRVHDDLVGSGYKILFVGDHGQLPPVGDDPGIMRRPDFSLERIHRQEDDLLLDFAHCVREDRLFVWPEGGTQDAVVYVPAGSAEVEQALEEADVVVCLKNATRHQINRLMLGRLLEYEVEDDGEAFAAMLGLEIPTVCVQNNYRVGVFNGQHVTMRLTDVRDYDRGYLVADLDLDGKVRSDVLVSADGFLSNPGELEHDDSRVFLDFGWALTCHKAQGSEFDHVAVIDETWFRYEHRARWRYTAATRARRKLSWIS